MVDDSVGLPGRRHHLPLHCRRRLHQQHRGICVTVINVPKATLENTHFIEHCQTFGGGGGGGKRAKIRN